MWLSASSVRLHSASLALAAILGASAGAAQAQTPPGASPSPAPATAGLAAPDDRSAVVDELLVVARPLGPAMWKATRGDSQVIILGSISPLPHQPPWDTRRLERQMAGAREVLLPPSGRVGGLAKVSMALTLSRFKLGRGQTLPRVLPANLRARYLETVGLFGMNQKRYDGWKPAAAGVQMLSDFRERAGLSSAKPASTIARLAKAHGVPVRYVGSGAAMAIYNGSKALPAEAQNRCLAMALDEIDREADFARPTAAAWAKGDLETVRRNYPAPVLEGCLDAVPNYRALVDKGVQDAAVEVQKALATPGKTIVVIDVNFLIRRDGLLDKLKAAGAEITEPLD